MKSIEFYQILNFEGKSTCYFNDISMKRIEIFIIFYKKPFFYFFRKILSNNYRFY